MQTVRSWFLKGAPEAAISKHFVAVSTNLEAIAQFGITSENTFPCGLFFAMECRGTLHFLCRGLRSFWRIVAGGNNEMDLHFQEAPLKRHSCDAGLISVWYNNFYGAETECIVPYCQYLNKLVAYLQQGIMENNGKKWIAMGIQSPPNRDHCLGQYGKPMHSMLFSVDPPRNQAHPNRFYCL